MKQFGMTKKQLGMIYREENTTFRVWSPKREDIKLVLYKDKDLEEEAILPMVKGEDGVHELVHPGDHQGKFYNFLIDGEEVTDPYSVSSAINSKASAIIDLEKTDPEGFREHTIKNDREGLSPVVYEAHIKDFTGGENSGAQNRGKYLGFAQEGLRYKGYKTGIDHLKELGVSHIHLMPVYDFITVDEKAEKFLEDDNYNWGYDPELYNTPEGSYATDPEDPASRVKELKTLIMKLHENGFKVILDVVYNHTYKSLKSNFNKIMPDYYYRKTLEGEFSDGSGVGNEIDTAKPMARKFILDSLEYWVEEYKVDGFRFDLLGLIDIETTRIAVERLKEVKPDIFIYGEPWVAGETTLPYSEMSLKGTQKDLGFAYFNDDFRNSIKGDSTGGYPGFSAGNIKHKQGVELGIVGSIDYGQSHKGFTNHPSESINYIDSHDDLIFYDKVAKVSPTMMQGDIERLNRFAFSILFTAQGVPFITSGNELLRSKEGIPNTYNAPLSINAIDWELKEENRQFFKYFKDLIKLKKTRPEFNLESSQEIKAKIKFMDFEQDKNIIIYSIKSEKGYTFVVHNGKFADTYIPVDEVISFLNSSYDENIEQLDTRKIFSVDGAINRHYNKDIKELYIPYMTTYVYTLSARQI